MFRIPEEFRPVEESTFFDWVEIGCSGPLNLLNRYIPAVFESYVHICHPVWQYPANVKLPSFTNATNMEQDQQMIPIRLSKALKSRFPEFDGKSCWGDVGTPIDYNNLSPGDIASPYEGVPPVEAVIAVEKAISTVTGPEQECIFAIWARFGDMCLGQPHLSRMLITGMAQQEHWLMQAPRSILFDYWRTILEIPNYYWSADRTPHAVWSIKQQWFYAVPFHRDSSFFGGTKEMAQMLLDSAELECYLLPEGHAFKY